MIDPLSSSLVARVQGLILDTFDVPEEEAREHASGLVLLAEGWGSPQSAAHLDWSHLVKKRLGEKLRWRSEEERERFARERHETFDAYEEYIRRGKRTK